MWLDAKFLSIRGSLSCSQQSHPFELKIPGEAACYLKVIDDTRNNFQKYVCCPTCQSIYLREQCIVKLPNGQTESKRFSFVHFPNHPQAQHRKPCDTVLMKKVKSSTANVLLYQKMDLFYKSIIESLQELLNRSDLSSKCEAWCAQSFEDGVYKGV